MRAKVAVQVAFKYETLGLGISVPLNVVTWPIALVGGLMAALWQLVIIYIEDDNLIDAAAIRRYSLGVTKTGNTPETF